VVECSEESGKEKDFGCDKKDYSIPQAFLNRGCMMALESALSDNISPSLVHGKDC